MITTNTIDLNSLSLEELQAHLACAESTLKVTQEAIRASTVTEVRRLVAAAGLTHADVFPPKPATGTGRKLGLVAPKYRNPADATQTWSGRGLKPTWLAAAIEAGATLDSFLIEQAAPAAADAGL